MLNPSLFTLMFCVCGFVSQNVSAATVEYSGKLFANELLNSVSGAYVIAGTFAPGYDVVGEGTLVSGYVHDNLDADNNLEPGAYDRAVANGIFIPIGLGAITFPDGAFSASGTTNASVGTPIWLFAFGDGTTHSNTQVLASSSDTAWLTPAQPSGSTTISASDTNLFVLGVEHPEGVALAYLPTPEPTSLVLSLLGGLVILGSRRGR